MNSVCMHPCMQTDRVHLQTCTHRREIDALTPCLDTCAHPIFKGRSTESNFRDAMLAYQRRSAESLRLPIPAAVTAEWATTVLQTFTSTQRLSGDDPRLCLLAPYAVVLESAGLAGYNAALVVSNVNEDASPRGGYRLGAGLSSHIAKIYYVRLGDDMIDGIQEAFGVLEHRMQLERTEQAIAEAREKKLASTREECRDIHRALDMMSPPLPDPLRSLLTSKAVLISQATDSSTCILQLSEFLVTVDTALANFPPARKLGRAAYNAWSHMAMVHENQVDVDGGWRV
jgi:hypothetical protein